MMRARTYALIPVLVSTALIAGCGGGPRPATGQAPATLAGSWALRTQDGTRRGPLLELAIDSVSGSTFRVRVAFLMSGDMGIDPARFESALGTVSAGGLVTFNVKMREATDPVGRLSGTMGQDTIRLQQFRWAGEDQTAGGTQWLLVKQP